MKTVIKNPVKLTVTGDPVILTVVIGDGQLGGTNVQFEGDPNPLAQGDITGLKLGSKANLANKTLDVTSVVHAISPTTDVSETDRFSGTDQNNFEYDDTVDNSGDFYTLTRKYQFQ